ncbi:MAG: DsrE family protein [Acidobacteriota bacterium]|nr:DsrE family protein [Acidobacteriota bacterium]
MSYLFVFNDTPYGNQRTFNGMRWALTQARKTKIKVFLLGDGVTAALAGFNPASADYNPQEMLAGIAATGAEIAACGTCLESRGMLQALIPQVQRGTLDMLCDWSSEADKVVTF